MSPSSSPPVIDAAIENSHQRSSGRKPTQLRIGIRDQFLGRRLDAPRQDAQFPPEQTLDLVLPARPAAAGQLLFLEAFVEDALCLLAMPLHAARGRRQRTTESGSPLEPPRKPKCSVMTTGSVGEAGISTVKWWGSISFGTPKPIVLFSVTAGPPRIDLDLTGGLLEELGQIGPAGELELAEADLDVGGFVADRFPRGADERLDGVGFRSVPGPNRVVAFLSPLPTVTPRRCRTPPWSSCRRGSR